MYLNTELRSEVLEFSLFLEDSVNSLILLSLGIFDDRNATRLFGNKASISFKNKIDLLYDIGILSKEENSDLELLMVFRNKFLHDLSCNTFLIVLEQLDKGIRNKFQMHIPENGSIAYEESCKTACRNLFLSNIKTLKSKVSNKRIKSERKHEIVKTQNEEIIYQIDLFYDLIGDLFRIIEESELENEKVRTLAILISEKCQEYLYKKTSEKPERKDFLSQTDISDIKNYFNINRVLPDSLMEELKMLDK